MRRVTRPAGRTAVTIWTGRPTIQATLLAESLAAAEVAAVSGQALPDDRDFDRSVDELASLARSAGLTAIPTNELNRT